MRKVSAPQQPRSAAPVPYVAGVDYDVLDELLGFSLRRAQLAMFASFYAATRGLGITPTRFTALVIIGANPGASQSALGEVLGIARSGAAQLADWAEQRGLVERRRRPNDGRAWGLYLTAAGERMLRESKRRVLAEDRRRGAAMGAGNRRKVLLQLLRKLAG